MEGHFGATFRRWKAPYMYSNDTNYIFPVNSFAIGGRRTIAKGAFGAQGELGTEGGAQFGAQGPCPPPLPSAYTPGTDTKLRPRVVGYSGG